MGGYTKGITRNTLEWLGLIAVFLVAGAVGHDPWWKRGEAYSFGIVYDFYESHRWLIPRNAGNPFMEKPPLYYWTATLFCRLLDGVLPLHDAARLASVFYSAVAAFFTWKSADVLFRSKPEHAALRTITLALLLGTYGLVHFIHALITDTALLAGTAITLYGFAVLCSLPKRWLRAGMWLGIGTGVAFMAKGLMMPGVLVFSGILLCLLLPQLRTRTTSYSVMVALAASSPFLLIWPLLLYHESRELFVEWMWDNNIGRFLGFSVQKLGAINRPLYFLWITPIFAFPSFPLACIEAACGRRQWRNPQYLLPLVFSATGIAMLLFSASGRDIYLLPLIPGFALLGAQALPRLPALFLLGWNRAIRIAFSVAVLTAWLVWISLQYPQQTRPFAWLPALFDKWLPGNFVPPEHQPMACAAAFLAALFWCASLRVNARSAEHTARIWFTGAAALWCTTHTLLLPWINETKSLRSVLTELTEFVAKPPYKSDCIGSFDLGENITPMLHYFTHSALKMPEQNWDGSNCPLMLTFDDKKVPPIPDARWRLVWRGARLHDIRNMELRLYARTSAQNSR